MNKTIKFEEQTINANIQFILKSILYFLSVE